MRKTSPRSTFVAIDFEVASFDRASACAIGLVRVEEGRIVRRESRLIRPPTPDFCFTYVHGLEWTDVRRARGFAAVWRELAPVWRGAAFFAAHNAGFDRSVLEACAARFGVKVPATPFRCTWRLARDTWRLPAHRLEVVARHLGLPLRHHDPLSDAEVCARIVLAAGAHAGRHRRSA